jgi:DNA polymerase III sliding clamp (beta) subunit (PCNA family)
MEILLCNPAKADLFTALFQHMKLFTEHITLVCQEDQVYMQCVDNSNVSIVEFFLPADWFDRYSNTTGEHIRIGLNATYLHRILSSRNKGQQMHMVYSTEDNDRLMVHLTSCADSLAAAAAAADDESTAAPPNPTKTKPKKKGEAAAVAAAAAAAAAATATASVSGAGNASFDMHFELPLIDISEEQMSIPPFEYAAEIQMESFKFSETITKLKMFGDTVDLTCSEERIILTSTSHDQGKMFVEIFMDDLVEFAIEEGATLELSFSLTYLKNMCSYQKLSTMVLLKFSEERPLQMTYPLDKDPSGNGARMVFYLAPKFNDS